MVSWVGVFFDIWIVECCEEVFEFGVVGLWYL